MSSVHRFTLGGTADTSLGAVLRAGYQLPALPASRDRAAEVPGRHGVYLFDSDLGPRMITLDLTILDATTMAGLQTLVRAFSAVLLDQDGKPEDVSLVFDMESTKTYTVRYAGNLPLARLIGGSLGEFSLPLLAADPFAYEAEDTDTYNVVAAYQTMAVENAGDYRTPPTFTITINGGSPDVTGFTLIDRQLK